MKSTLLNKYIAIALTVIFAITLFLFWRFAYPYALVYQEQYQLFLFDSSYICSKLILPGGIATIIAEYLTQFYNHPTLGASIQMLLLVLIQLVTWGLMKGYKGKLSSNFEIAYISSFLPALTLWYALGDESVLTTYSVSLLLVLIIMYLHPKNVSIAYMAIAIPVIYWIVGPLVLLYVSYVALQSFRKKALLFPLLILVYAIFCIVISAQWLPYPSRRLFAGLFYYRFVDTWSPLILIVIPLICLLLSFQIEIRISSKIKHLLFAVWGIIIVVVSSILISNKFDTKTYELMEYDYLVRRQQWDAIVAKAEQKQPDLPMSVCATNLALGMKNQLGHRAFHFYQHGTEGLLPKFQRDFTSALLTGEVYFYLGLINTAQRHAFEAMEAIPNYNKSGRIVKRLAETNLINGQYKVAEKYLRMLEKTIFYKAWAKDKLQLIANEEQINKHPFYGPMRQFRLQNDFLFSDIELDKIFGQLFMHNPKNSLAIQYLLIHPLLNKDVNLFMNYLTAVQEKVSYNPPVCQQAIVFAYTQRQQSPPQGFVSQNVLQQFKQFMQVYSQGGPLEVFKGTLWYYLMKE